MKNLFFPLFIFAMAMSSCATDDVTDVVSSPLDDGDAVSINVYAGTTKGTDMTTSGLETSGYVLLHIDDADDDNLTYEFKYSGGDWAQTASTAIKWSTIAFPANFYSLHDGEPITMTFNDDSATYEGYEILEKSTSHKDLVYHASQLSMIPTGGTVSVYHKHALSKIHLYAATGGNKVYIARANLVNIDGMGNVTITPLSAADIATANGVSWVNSGTSDDTYLYYDLDDFSLKTPEALVSTTTGSVIINYDETAPMMIIPQTTKAASITTDETADTTEDTTDTAGLVAEVSGSYVEVIYYLTDANNMPVVGYSSVAARPDANEYCTDDQGKALYVMGGFPLGHTFLANKEYDITLGLGSTGSSGGKLLVDYYVNKDGEPVSLTKIGEDEESPVEIPEIDEGDDILGDSDDDIDIVVSAHDWEDGTDHTIN